MNASLPTMDLLPLAVPRADRPPGLGGMPAPGSPAFDQLLNAQLAANPAPSPSPAPREEGGTSSSAWADSDLTRQPADETVTDLASEEDDAPETTETAKPHPAALAAGWVSMPLIHWPLPVIPAPVAEVPVDPGKTEGTPTSASSTPELMASAPSAVASQAQPGGEVPKLSRENLPAVSEPPAAIAGSDARRPLRSQSNPLVDQTVPVAPSAQPVPSRPPRVNESPVPAESVGAGRRGRDRAPDDAPPTDGAGTRVTAVPSDIPVSRTIRLDTLPVATAPSRVRIDPLAAKTPGVVAEAPAASTIRPSAAVSFPPRGLSLETATVPTTPVTPAPSVIATPASTSVVPDEGTLILEDLLAAHLAAKTPGVVVEAPAASTLRPSAAVSFPPLGLSLETATVPTAPVTPAPSAIATPASTSVVPDEGTLILEDLLAAHLAAVDAETGVAVAAPSGAASASVPSVTPRAGAGLGSDENGQLRSIPALYRRTGLTAQAATAGPANFAGIRPVADLVKVQPSEIASAVATSMASQVRLGGYETGGVPRPRPTTDSGSAPSPALNSIRVPAVDLELAAGAAVGEKLPPTPGRSTASDAPPTAARPVAPTAWPIKRDHEAAPSALTGAVPDRFPDFAITPNSHADSWPSGGTAGQTETAAVPLRSVVAPVAEGLPDAARSARETGWRITERPPVGPRELPEPIVSTVSPASGTEVAEQWRSVAKSVGTVDETTGVVTEPAAVAFATVPRPVLARAVSRADERDVQSSAASTGASEVDGARRDGPQVTFQTVEVRSTATQSGAAGRAAVSEPQAPAVTVEATRAEGEAAHRRNQEISAEAGGRELDSPRMIENSVRIKGAGAEVVTTFPLASDRAPAAYGTPVAKQEVVPFELSRVDETLRGEEQILPGDHWRTERDATGERTDGGNKGFEPRLDLPGTSGMAPTSMGGTDRDSTQRVMAPHETAQRIQQVIEDAVLRLRVPGQKSMELTFRADATTELRVEFRQQGEVVVASVHFLSGDAARLGADWSQLQDRLDRQGVRVVMPDQLAGGGTGMGSHDRHSRQSGARFAEADWTAAAPPPRPTPARPGGAPAKRGVDWEVWA